MTPTYRALVTLAVFAGAPAVVIGLILLFSVGWIAGLVVFVAVGAALAGWARLDGERRILARLAGRPADPRTDARLLNLVDGLITAAGVRHPRVVVVDSPGLNAAAFGTSASNAVLAVTSGLLAELDRIELEAVLAEEIYLIRHQETAPATVLAATFGVGRSLAVRADHDACADQGAVSLTRYPPGLAAALEKIERKGPAVAGQPDWMAHLWLADPRPAPSAPGPGRLALHDRVEALREL
ncbi:MAG TPA: M48 family metalloprotease [Acidimicrobiales bacterium]|nr:M48 family metalloprotease [Acidimicrobiales bacterium]